MKKKAFSFKLLPSQKIKILHTQKVAPVFNFPRASHFFAKVLFATVSYFNIISLTPILEVNTGKLKSIISSYPRWLTPVFNEFIEFSSYSCAGNGYIDSNPKTFSIKIIYDVKCPKTFTL